MSNSILRSPYTVPRGQKETANFHRIAGTVSTTEYAEIAALFPLSNNISDYIVSTLFKKFYDEFKRVNDDRVSRGLEPLEPAWSADHDTYWAIRNIMGRCTFGGPSGVQREVGQTSGRDDGRGAGSVCPTCGTSTFQPPNSESSDSSGVSETRGQGTEGQRESSPSSVGHSDEIKDYLKIVLDL